ncbi:photosystem II stability/assembly factor-like protein [Pseudomonas sp. MAP12]|uniref:Photosystem II stability/assembly factor-like protein n=2 Tax=Geopseudomonas aromaticivorans TaxID=2849492 RepID=A0ABS6MV92_9GAMM|nr:YCF48-related protein [Pseudomonas aromaticivorans]MBV2132182.1 photosystem II stability/assembly factor-like protein [Pseudomonas aromaticivorans]
MAAAVAPASAEQADSPQVASRNVPDTLDQPAARSSLASRSMLSALATAGERIVAVGVRGHIVYSDDRGQSWQQASVPVSVTLTGVCFADAQTGWAVGHRGVILKTVDGGQNWSKQFDGLRAATAIVQARELENPERVHDARRLESEGADKPFLDVQCLDRQQVVAVGAFGLGFATRDGGNSWTPSLALLDGTEQRHVNVARLLDGKLYLAGELGMLLRLGSDLQQLESLGEPYAGSFFGLVVSRQGSLLAFGLRGNLFRSTDAGASWQQVELASSQSLTAGVNLSDGGILLVDESGAGWLSLDDGQSFKSVKPTAQFPFAGLLATAEGGGVAVGVNGISFFEPGALR